MITFNSVKSFPFTHSPSPLQSRPAVKNDIHVPVNGMITLVEVVDGSSSAASYTVKRHKGGGGGGGGSRESRYFTSWDEKRVGYHPDNCSGSPDTKYRRCRVRQVVPI